MPSRKANWTREPLQLAIKTVCDEIGVQTVEFRYNIPRRTLRKHLAADKRVFKLFETYWDQEVLKYWSSHLGRTISRQNFSLIFRSVWLKSMTPHTKNSGKLSTKMIAVQKTVATLHGKRSKMGPSQGNSSKASWFCNLLCAVAFNMTYMYMTKVSVF
ncbi:hypothetical protein PGB90_006329 [Kerria lacca]